jgi:hypothetical protein
MKDSLGREPRWNADRCAPAVCRRGRARKARQNTIASVGVLLPILFLSWRAKIKRQAPPPALCLCCSFRALRMPNCEWISIRRSLFARFHSSDAKPRREDGETHPPPRGDRTKCGGGGASLDFEEDIDRSHYFWATPLPPRCCAAWSPFPAVAGKDGMSARRERECLHLLAPQDDGNPLVNRVLTSPLLCYRH